MSHFKLRMSIVLPIVQVAVALAMLKLAALLDSRTVLPYGVLRNLVLALNGPAVLSLFCVQLFPVQMRTGHFIGISAPNLVFLAGVAVLWWVIGRILDRRRGQVRIQSRSLLVASDVATFCIGLLVIGVASVPARAARSIPRQLWGFGTFVESGLPLVLYGVWVGILLISPVAHLCGYLRRDRPTPKAVRS